MRPIATGYKGRADALHVRVGPKRKAAVDAKAKAQGVGPSDVVRAALDVYLDTDDEELATA